MVPADKPIQVFLETVKTNDPATIKQWADAQEAELNKRRSKRLAACRKLDEEYNGKTSEFIESWGAIAKGFQKFEQTMKEISALCAGNIANRAQIRSLVATVLAAESQIRALLNTANQKAAVCKTKADADAIDALWSSIVKLTWEVHLNAGKAEGLNNRIKNVVTRSLSLLSRMDRPDAETPVALSQLPEKEKELLDGLTKLRDNIASLKSYGEMVSARKELSAFESALLKSLSTYPSTPVINRLRTIVQDSMKDDPCSEGEMRNRLDRTISYLSKTRGNLIQRIADLKTKYPLCAGDSAEDIFIAQARNAQDIIIYVRSSDIPAKAEACRTDAGKPKPPAPVPAPTPPPVKDDDKDGVPNDRDKCPGTPLGHPVDADGCSLLQKFAAVTMKINGPNPVIPAKQSLFKAIPDAQMAILMQNLTGALIYKWYINGKEVGRGTENFFYTLSSGYRGSSIIVKARLFWFNKDGGETPLQQGSATFAVKRIDIGKVPMKVTCLPSVAPPGTRVSCAAKIDDPVAAAKLNELGSVGGRWGFYWYVNNAFQGSTGDSISATIPKTGGTEVVARLMVTDPTALSNSGYEADYGGPRPTGAQPQEAGRATATLRAQPVTPQPQTQPQTVRKKYGPFAVPWGSWFSTGINIKKGESFSTKATGAYKSVNQNTDVKTCGPDGCGYWRFFVMKAKVGSKMRDVGSSGGWTAEDEGVIELGAPRGTVFMKEDAGNCTGAISVEIWVDHKTR